MVAHKRDEPISTTVTATVWVARDGACPPLPAETTASVAIGANQCCNSAMFTTPIIINRCDLLSVRITTTQNLENGIAVTLILN